ncbi:beta-ketoacyl-ACP synthase III [Sulfurospirillum deleyianum]|uniref:3-Oxoacyl-(Acyl-carrier-protein (ACP)) synthase III domain protein n=1 Tax=Sulfurospirillum deleyianum (strain ATCC 51133 / DSM 6946 / 5175) TaxID=525898 RepID=D1B4W0_SULD5|nr:beta-ketoacyl-ACP synthase III [Sulfurospirillum deleyianum]ACZ13130.1 3-Oxoacyl-(acyl-carrier-protein (ACP)) synthase III domain protein [Sulfurospirillum deleyianum DSM 6946]
MNNAVYINDIQTFMPNQPVSNEEMEEYLGYIGGKKSKAKAIVLRSNGIKQRYYVLEKGTQKALFSNAQITANAIKKLESEHFKLETIEALCCGSTTPDQLMPNHTLMVQGELGISEIETLSASGICLSGVNALKYLYYGIKSGELSVGVATGSEVVSPILSAKNFEEESKQWALLEANPTLAFEKDFLRWMLSDGAGAMVLQNRPNEKGISLKIEWIEVLSYAGQMPTCMYSGCEMVEGKPVGWRNYTQSEIMEKSLLSIAQDVKLLNENIVEYTVVKPLKKILAKRALVENEINYFLPHYSSHFFRDKLYAGMVEAGLEIPYEKWFTNLPYCGNTGSASIYIMLEELFHSKSLKKGEKILCYIPESGRFSTAFMLLEVV